MTVGRLDSLIDANKAKYIFWERDMRWLNSLLNEHDISCFLIQKGENPDIVVAAIHHAPTGIKELPCDRHKVSDEAVGQIALIAARRLRCTYIVASNYFLDLNKPDPYVEKEVEQTDYKNWLSHNKPLVLVEIHGHNGNSAKYDIEISSGEQREKHALEFAKKLEKRMSRCQFKRGYTISGDYKSIYFKASKAVTINTTSWLAFHIELCPDLRTDKSEAQRIARCIAYMVRDIYATLD